MSVNLKDYEQHLLANGYSQSTVKQMTCQASRFITGGYEFSLSGAEKFSIENKRGTPASQNSMLRQIKRFFVWLNAQGLVEGGDSTIERFPTSPRTSVYMPRVVGDEDLSQLLANTPDKYHIAILLMHTLGLREAELLGLQWEDFNFIEKSFTITRKGGQQQTLPYDVTPELESLIESKSKAHGPVVQGRIKRGVNEAPEQMSASGFWKVISRAAKQAGIEHVHPHSMRHGFACGALERGVNMNVIQNTLCHKSMNTTMLYLKGLTSNVESIRAGLKRDK